MNGRLVFLKGLTQGRGSGPVVLDIAELVLEVPGHRPERNGAKLPRREPRKREEWLVPDSGSSGELVPDSWGGTDLT